MPHSEILHTFDERRREFMPYGLTCELWTPSSMRRPDRHNEIELNFFPEGSMTYLFQGRKVTVAARRLTVFWGLIPHQIIHSENPAPYYICTIPLAQFLEWGLPPAFVSRVLSGEAVGEATEHHAAYDTLLLRNWLHDLRTASAVDVTLLEMRARLTRLAATAPPAPAKAPAPLHEVGPVERIALYIARHYCQPLTAAAVGAAVGLHPDYANAVFRKAFGRTLGEYITEERISHAQRQLVTTSLSITAIAFACGFNSLSRFNAAFRQKNGCTPRQFRRQYSL